MQTHNGYIPAGKTTAMQTHNGCIPAAVVALLAELVSELKGLRADLCRQRSPAARSLEAKI
jgi:hypothetical protein